MHGNPRHVRAALVDSDWFSRNHVFRLDDSDWFSRKHVRLETRSAHADVAAWACSGGTHARFAGRPRSHEGGGPRVETLEALERLLRTRPCLLGEPPHERVAVLVHHHELAEKAGRLQRKQQQQRVNLLALSSTLACLCWSVD